MGPKRGRPTAGSARNAARGVENEPVQPAVQGVDQDALRQMVQDAARQAAQDAIQQVTQEAVRVAAQEAARVAAQEAARIAAQEVARQMAVGQQIPPAAQVQGQQIPPAPQVQVQQGPQINVQQAPQIQVQPVPPVPVQPVPVQPDPQVFQVPPPPPPIPAQIPAHVPEQVAGDTELLIRMMGQMKTVELEYFSGTTDAAVAHNWKHRLIQCLKTVVCPMHLCLNVAELYLRGDAAVWWDGVRSIYHDLTYADFLQAFDKKYFPRETLHQKRNDFEHLRQGTRTVREYELEFSRLRRLARVALDQEDLIRRFLDGLRVELRGRCSLVTYTTLEDLVEKAVIQETCMAQEQKLKAGQPKSGRTSESQQRTWDQTGAPICGRCRRSHHGDCVKCFNCGRLGHVSKHCRNRPGDTRVAAPAATATAATAVVDARGACYYCGEKGHIIRDCPKRGNATQAPAAKRQAVAPRVFAVGDHSGAEPIAGM